MQKYMLREHIEHGFVELKVPSIQFGFSCKSCIIIHSPAYLRTGATSICIFLEVDCYHQKETFP